MHCGDYKALPVFICLGGVEIRGGDDGLGKTNWGKHGRAPHIMKAMEIFHACVCMHECHARMRACTLLYTGPTPAHNQIVDPENGLERLHRTCTIL